MHPTQRRSVIYSQNFLKHPTVARRIIATSSIEPADLVVEIGPGAGMLTRVLAERARQVLAIEKDPQFARRLRQRLEPHDNVIIFEADSLDFPLPLTPYKVFANIPFNRTAAIVTRLTDATNPPAEASLVMQREAAERFLGIGSHTLVSVLMHPWFDCSVVYRFRSGDFAPPPGVDVVLLRISKRGPPLISDSDRQGFRDFVIHGFTAWKPNLREAYRPVLTQHQLRTLATSTDIDLGLKPSMVSATDWLTLYRCFAAMSTPKQRRRIAGTEDRLREQQQHLEKVHRTRTRRHPAR